MKKGNVLTFLLISGISLVSCDELSVEPYEQTYTIIWQNDDGTILEMDRNVKEGALPTYDGGIPTKQGNDRYSYEFAGWDIQIAAVTENISYTATFKKVENKFTVTWVNHDGAVLEVDENVAYGSLPTYNGSTPKKENDGDISYIFMGWSNSISEVTSDVTYTAKFIQMSSSDWVAGIQPVVSEDGKTIQYGFYPQSNVNDQSLINVLNTLTPSEVNGWYFYDGNYYTKEAATLYNNESYTFVNGTKIVEGTEYWYKCEPITWNVLEENNGVYYLMSSMLLDVQSFYKDYETREIEGNTIKPNNYEYSGIRTWLNSSFYNTAFGINYSFVVEKEDKVLLPSYEDCLNANYGFSSNEKETSNTRTALTTDYARANGAWCNVTNDLKNNSVYWTRSAGSFDYTAWVVTSGGYLSSYAVDGKNHCVRPCVYISLT